ncbi:uncharacterized protein BJ171DRAFT_494310 [Polychytrium aggregatum]|uniref:uncharacterized protein n=1 Tax=Polychytrium aggregatum TaxID=110093 RepID=UPI0022FEAFA8|nr:uncharacterized protein BJ171DRAFT_494310 [Polychytrium aggregatum]KAI9207329.1 hypothetical protein BJ171DRAFT_494310 [Polychytrium aggregatum]
MAPDKKKIKTEHTKEPEVEVAELPDPDEDDEEEEDDDLDNVLSLEDQEAISELLELEEQFSSREDELRKELEKIEAKYNAANNNLYKQRDQIASKIKGFWGKALLTIFGSSSEDEANLIIDHLAGVSVTFDKEHPRAFKAVLKFSANEYFSNTALNYELKFKDDEPIIVPAKINWKPGKNLTHPAENDQASKKRDHDGEHKHDIVGGDVGLFSWLQDDDVCCNIEQAQALAHDYYKDALKVFLGLGEYADEFGEDDDGDDDGDDDEDEGEDEDEDGEDDE